MCYTRTKSPQSQIEPNNIMEMYHKERINTLVNPLNPIPQTAHEKFIRLIVSTRVIGILLGINLQNDHLIIKMNKNSMMEIAGSSIGAYNRPKPLNPLPQKQN